MWVRAPGWEDALEEGMATPSPPPPVFLSGEPHKQEPGGLQSIRLQRRGHSWSHQACMYTCRDTREPCFVKYQCLGLSEGSALYCALRAVSKVSSCHLRMKSFQNASLLCCRLLYCLPMSFINILGHRFPWSCVYFTTLCCTLVKFSM